MFPNVGLGEMIVIVIVALVVFGPKRLPEMMRSAGKALRTLQTESQRAAADLREAVGDPGAELEEIKEISRSIIMDTPDAPPERPAPLPPKRSTEPTAKPAAKKVAASRRKAAPKKPSSGASAKRPAPAKKKSAATPGGGKAAAAKRSPAKRPAGKRSAAKRAVAKPATPPLSDYPPHEDT